MILRLITMSVLVVVVHSQAVAANWGHWRGAAGNGVATDANPPVRWSADENVQWKVNLPGRGSGSPIVWDDQVFVVTAIGADAEQPNREPTGRLQFALLCFDRNTGKLQWQRKTADIALHEGTHRTNGYASASPCTDGVHVFAHFGSRGLFCFTMDGEPVWNRDLGDMTTRATFGEGSSPTLIDGTLLVPWDHEGQSYLFALDAATGETQWRVARDEPTCWATPLVIKYGGGSQVVMNGENYARSYDLKTGKELWRCGGQTQRPVASAVSANGLVFIGSGFRGSFLGAFRPDGEGDIGGTSHVAWTVSRDTPDIASPLLSNGRLYFFKGKSGVLTCLDAVTGKPHYTAKRTGLGTIYASPVAAGGHVYLTDRSGKTAVIKDADTFEIVATNSVGETVDATPAPVDDQLFIRGEEHLFCIAR